MVGHTVSPKHWCAHVPAGSWTELGCCLPGVEQRNSPNAETEVDAGDPAGKERFGDARLWVPLLAFSFGVMPVGRKLFSLATPVGGLFSFPIPAHTCSKAACLHRP